MLVNVPQYSNPRTARCAHHYLRTLTFKNKLTEVKVASFI
jgi:hypothetical protein